MVLQSAPRRLEMAFPEKDVEEDVPGKAIGVESPEAHLIEQLFHERLEHPAPVEPEQTAEGGKSGDCGAAEVPELADKRMGGEEAGDVGVGEEAVEGGRRLEVAGAAGAQKEEGARPTEGQSREGRM